MILVTVGTQLPFDRFISAVDAVFKDKPMPVYAQIGKGKYIPSNIDWVRDLPAKDFDELVKSSDLIIAHAGIGTVLKAFKHNKPIILFPRESKFGEHRNDHQIATANSLAPRNGIYLARNIEDLNSLLSQTLLPPTNEESISRVNLIKFVREQLA